MFERAVSQYAPAGRSAEDTIQFQRKLLKEHHGSLRQLYDAVSEIILVLNTDRQIVFFNSAVPSLLGLKDPEALYGMRPGEALGCVYACRNTAGCGTSDYCSQCGAVNAILAALSNQADLQECRVLTQNQAEALDLLVRTTPIEVKGYVFVVMAISDISHEKRRRALERIFFHDIMNTAATIHLLAEMLNREPQAEDAAVLRENLFTGTKQLMEELCSQKELLAAENDELVVRKQLVDAYLLIKEVVEVFRNRFREHIITLASPYGDILLRTDCGLLQRVLGNMIRNALEASRTSDPVRIACCLTDGFVEFHVHNIGAIPHEVQLRLFQRSFSTKGPGRGLGTYSMKLLSERYLKGDIRFTSSPGTGTTFVARYPLE